MMHIKKLDENFKFIVVAQIKQSVIKTIIDSSVAIRTTRSMTRTASLQFAVTVRAEVEESQTK